ncbi:MAG: rhodanese-like domain-containing protein [Deltaproteobacteria bacterium]|nr:rhodanese-like domain-containing protein [Deltaproteobacteria bacterium]
MPDLLALVAAAIVVAALWLAMKSGRVAPAEAARLVRDGAVLLDVRSETEFAEGHLPGAVHAPVDVLRARPLAFAEKDQPVVVYCRSGARSALAARALRAAGCKHVFNLGPMAAWPSSPPGPRSG